MARTIGTFLGLLSNDHDGSHELSIAVAVDLHSWREKFCIGIAILVAESRRGCTDVRRNPLSGNFDPLAADVVIAETRKLKGP